MHKKVRKRGVSLALLLVSIIAVSCTKKLPITEFEGEKQCGVYPPNSINIHWSGDTLFSTKRYFDRCSIQVPLMIRAHHKKLSFSNNTCTADLGVMVSELDSSVVKSNRTCHYISMYLFSLHSETDYSTAPLRRLTVCEPDSVVEYRCMRPDTAIHLAGWPF